MNETDLCYDLGVQGHMKSWNSQGRRDTNLRWRLQLEKVISLGFISRKKNDSYECCQLHKKEESREGPGAEYPQGTRGRGSSETAGESNESSSENPVLSISLSSLLQVSILFFMIIKQYFLHREKCLTLHTGILTTEVFTVFITLMVL